MFATLGGALPAPRFPRAEAAGDDPLDVADPAARDELVARVVGDQVLAGLEPVTDGGLRHRDAGHLILGSLGAGIVDQAPVFGSRPTWRAPILVESWGFTAGLTDRASKQSLPGPFTLGLALGPGPIARDDATLALAEALNAELHALADAGCPLVEVVEDGATRIGDSPAERRLFIDAQRRLLGGLDGSPIHASLAIRGGNADTAGVATILDAPYRSYLFDLCAGPDNWRLIVDVPADRGVVVGAADARTAAADPLEVLAFAIGYAASTRGRGHDRVGVATSGDMSGLDYPTALAKIRRVGEIAALYAGPPDALARALDPRAIDARSAALGRFAPGLGLRGLQPRGSTSRRP